MRGVEHTSAHTELAGLLGYAVNWEEPGWPKFLPGQPQFFATREVISGPASSGLDGDTAWQAMRAASAALLSGAALIPGCHSFEVRYQVEPQGQGSAAIRIFLTAKAIGAHPAAAEAAVDAATRLLPTGFDTASPASAIGGGGDTRLGDVIVELRRDEELTQPQWDYIPADFYYALNDEPGDGSGWPAFWSTLAASAQPATVSLLFQQAELSWDERNTLGRLMTELSRFAEQRTEYDLMNRPVVFPACANAALALASWQQRLERLERPLLARLAVRADVSTAVTIAAALTTAISAGGRSGRNRPMFYETPELADMKQANFGFDWLEIVPWGGHGIWQDELAPLSLRRLPYLYGLGDASALLVLPVPDRQGVAGMSRARLLTGRREESALDGADDGPAVQLGAALHQGRPGSRIELPLAAINRHVLVVGEPGSGKTTTVLSLLAELWNRHHVPFLVIESVKSEYRSLIGTPGFEDLQIITLGNERLAPLRLNPLEPPPGVPCEIHQAGVLASLKLALPLFPPLPQLLSTALELTYEAAGWDDDSTIEDGISPPTLRDLRRFFAVATDRLNYQGEGRDVRPAFEARLDSLLGRYMGKMLDTRRSIDFGRLLQLPAVIEMNEIMDPDERSVLAALLLDRVRASAKRRGTSGGRLAHVTVIEEAHRLLARADENRGSPESGESGRADSVRAFCEAIGELRAMGEGFVLCSQSPAALAPAAIANTGTRIVHRMGSADDRRAMLDDLDADESVRHIAARLGRGEVISRWPQRDEVEIVRVHPAIGVDSGRQIAVEDVLSRMADYRDQLRELLPYRLCSDKVCARGCESRVRQVGRRVSGVVAASAATIWNRPEKPGSARIREIVELASECSSGDAQELYCVGAHLEANGVALTGASPEVVGERLTTSILAIGEGR